MAKVNWNKVKREYINGYISQEKLAEKHGIPYPTLRDRAKKEKWVNQRKEQREKIIEKTLEKDAEKLAEKEADINTKITTATEILIDNILVAIDQIAYYTAKEKRKYTRQVKGDNDKPIYVDIEEEIPKAIMVETKEQEQIKNADKLIKLANALEKVNNIRLARAAEQEQGNDICFVEDLEPDE